jgi:hypothetical protein
MMEPQMKDNSHLFRGTDQSLWEFWRDGVTSSFASAFRGCKEQTKLTYVYGRSPRSSTLAFDYGLINHYVLQHAYGPGQESVQPGKAWIEQALECYQGVWRNNNPGAMPWQEEQQELALGLASAVLPSYFHRWNGDFNGGKYTYGCGVTIPAEWLATEQQFEVPFRFPDGKETVIRGRMDGVFRDVKGRIWVLDTKCLSVVKVEDILDTMQYDFQHMIYLYAANWLYGEYPAGMIRNIVRRPTLYRRKNEETDAFCQRVRKDAENPKRWDHYFSRFMCAMTPLEIEQWQILTLNPFMLDVRLWWEGVTPHYANPDALVTKYGRCGLFNEIVKGDTTMSFRRTAPHPELEYA